MATDARTSTADPAVSPAATASFLDLEFDRLDLAAALTAIAARAPLEAFVYVVTPNVDHVVRFHRRPGLAAAYRHAWLTLCDSRILAHLAARRGLSLPVVPGSDLTAGLIRDILRAGDRIAVVGSTACDVDRLRTLCPGVAILHHDPPMGFIDDPHAVDHAARFVADARARYTLIAVGSPQQERLAHRISADGRATGTGLCVGASLDFLTGRQRRAPRVIQRMSLEWLFRLLSDPVRLWRRYMVDGPRIFLIWHRWLRR